ncbi:MAG: ABC transporter permease [Gemmatimonadota bacterium]|nr:ABC transporter permease [Gemmatimonadota bacterium]
MTTRRPEGHGSARQPPERADDLLRAWLPEGTVGLSILGDLYEEYDELVDRGAPAPDAWFWKNALALSARYALLKTKAGISNTDSMGGAVMELMSTLMTDVRFGLRMLAKTPLLSAVAVITIALGVALTTHTFSSVYGAILRGVPVPGHERLVYVGENRLEMGISDMEMSVHDFEDLRAQQTSFEDVGAFYQGTVNVAGEAGPPERFAGAYVSGNLLDLVGIQPIEGRLIRSEEEGPDADPVIVIGHHVWQNRFAGEPGVVGRMIRVNGVSTEIVGIMPEGFRFPFLEDVWLPHRVDANALERGQGSDFDVVGRLREGVSLSAAQAELSTVAARLEQTYPESNGGIGMIAYPYTDRFMPQEIQAVIWVMLAATFGVLLIACTNVANLLMARASIRSKEIAVRTALGAGRWRVIRQLLIESLVVATLGGAVGVFMAWLGVDAYRRVVADIYKPYWIDFRMDVPVIVFSLAVTALAAVAAGMLPALRASSLKIGEHLKDESRGASSLRLGRLSHALVVSEIAVSCALLIAAGFMIRSVVNLNNVDLGFETERVLTGRLGLFENDYPDPSAREQFFLQLEERLTAQPGIESAALTSSLPGLGGGWYYMSVEGVSYPTDADHPVILTSFVTSDFFRTLGVEPSQGRVFDPLEARGGGDPVAIVNESFAQTYLSGTPVLGERLQLGLPRSERPWHRVVGVVPDMHVGGNVGGIGDDLERPERAFFPFGAIDLSFASFAVKTRDDPESLAPSVRTLVAELDSNLPVYDLLSLERAIDDATWAFSLFGSLFTIFGAAALFLAAVGLYGVMAFGVSQRRRELAVRLALGAKPNALVRMVVGNGAGQLALGILIGVGLGAVMSRSMRVMLYGVETDDPVVYGSIVLTLAATGLLACVLPARSATRTDPVQAMRGD